MDIKEIIESGSLELYVMGALTAEEARGIEALRKEHPELNSEISRIEEAMMAYASHHAVTPAPELKEKIAGQLDFSVGLDMQTESVDSITIQMPGIYKLAAAASIALIVALACTTFYFGHRYRQEERQLILLRSQNEQLAGNLQILSNTTEKIKGDLAVANNPRCRKIVLNGQVASPNSKASLYWNQENGKTYIDMAALPAPPSDKQYQLWAMVIHTPVSLGVIPKNTEFASMQAVQNARAFCVTLEPLGGSKEPNREQMYVMTDI